MTEKVIKLNPSGMYDKIPTDLIEDNATIGENMELIGCVTCGRKFRADRLEKHQTACSKLTVGSLRRGPFKSRDVNTNISETEEKKGACDNTL